MQGVQTCEMVKKEGEVVPQTFEVMGNNRYCYWLGVVCPVVEQKGIAGLECRYSVPELQVRRAVVPAPIANSGRDF